MEAITPSDVYHASVDRYTELVKELIGLIAHACNASRQRGTLTTPELKRRFIDVVKNMTDSELSIVRAESIVHAHVLRQKRIAVLQKQVDELENQIVEYADSHYERSLSRYTERQKNRAFAEKQKAIRNSALQDTSLRGRVLAFMNRVRFVLCAPPAIALASSPEEWPTSLEPYGPPAPQEADIRSSLLFRVQTPRDQHPFSKIVGPDGLLQRVPVPPIVHSFSGKSKPVRDDFYEWFGVRLADTSEESNKPVTRNVHASTSASQLTQNDDAAQQLTRNLHVPSEKASDQHVTQNKATLSPQTEGDPLSTLTAMVRQLAQAGWKPGQSLPNSIQDILGKLPLETRMQLLQKLSHAESSPANLIKEPQAKKPRYDIIPDTSVDKPSIKAQSGEVHKTEEEEEWED